MLIPRLAPSWFRVLCVTIAVIGLTVFLIGLIISGRNEAQPSIEIETVLPVSVADIGFSQYSISVPVLAEVVARDYVTVIAPHSAQVLDIPYREGDSFAAEARLLSLDLFDSAYGLSLAQLSYADAQLEYSQLIANQASELVRAQKLQEQMLLFEKNLDRDEQLEREGVVSDVQVRSVRSSFLQVKQQYVQLLAQVDNHDFAKDVADKKIERLRINLEKIKDDYQHARLAAPFAGKVARVHAALGSKPLLGERLLEIYAQDSLQLKMVIPLQDVKTLELGKTFVIFEIDGTEHRLYLSSIEPINAEAHSSGVVAYIDLPKQAATSEKLLLGANYNLYLQLETLQDVVALPYTALYYSDSIFVLDDELRAREHKCQLLGNQYQLDVQQIILRCPDELKGRRVITTQRGDMSEGVKVQVVGFAQEGA